MSIASKYNRGHGKKFTFEIPKEFTYSSLHALYNNNGADFVYDIRAMYINKKSKFGESPVIATSNELVNFPKHLTDTVKEMLTDSEVIDAINNHVFGFQIYTYTDGSNVYYSVNWVDC